MKCFILKAQWLRLRAICLIIFKQLKSCHYKSELDLKLARYQRITLQSSESNQVEDLQRSPAQTQGII